MKNIFFTILSFAFLIFFSCSSINNSIIEIEDNIIIVSDTIVDDNINNTPKKNKLLALGDSYTIGQNVCEKCRFPEQLVDSLLKRTANKNTFPLKLIARTGWTTTNLINAIENENLASNYNLVTLLIGVNNQYQKKSFSIYEKEFPRLVNIAIQSLSGVSKNLIVLSIPDYAFTPFGKGNATISQEVKKYNDFAKSYCNKNNITFLNITDITANGLINPNLVANDGLHPSKEAYSKFVARLVPLVLNKLNLK